MGSQLWVHPSRRKSDTAPASVSFQTSGLTLISSPLARDIINDRESSEQDKIIAPFVVGISVWTLSDAGDWQSAGIMR